MHKFWSWLGLNLGKHWIAVLLVGGILTVGLGYGTTKLKFSTDQSNYLNKSDQVYKDNVAYQKLFGGEAMVTLVTMDPGHTVAELFTADGIKQWTEHRREDQRVAPGARRRDAAHGAPVEQQASCKGPNGDVTQSVAGKILAGDLARDKSKAGQAARNASALRDHRAHQRDSRRAAHARQPEVSRLPALRQPAAARSEADPHAAPPVLPRRPPRADGRAAPRQRVDQGRGQ